MKHKDATYARIAPAVEAVFYGAGATMIISGSNVSQLSDRAARTLVVEWLRYEVARRPTVDVVGAILRDAGALPDVEPE